MKKFILLVVVLLLDIFIYAAEWNVGFFGGVRYRSISPDKFSYGLFAGYDDFSIHFSGISADDFLITATYDLDIGRTIHNNFIIHSDNVPEEGGFSTLSYVFSQLFSWKLMILGYGVGVQTGISYSPFSSTYYSVIPLFDFRVGIHSDSFFSTIYCTMIHPETMEWKMTATAGAVAEIEIENGHFIFADAYFVFDNLIDVNTLVLSGWGIKAGYIYRGII